MKKDNLTEEMGLFDLNKDDYFNSIIEFFAIDESKPYLDNFGEKLLNWAKNSIPNINIISIFSGAGGLDIGFKDAGFNIISHLELEANFCKTLNINSTFFNNAEILNIDIRDYIPTNKNCDFLIGGPPVKHFLLQDGERQVFKVLKIIREHFLKNTLDF